MRRVNVAEAKASLSELIDALVVPALARGLTVAGSDSAFDRYGVRRVW